MLLGYRGLIKVPIFTVTVSVGVACLLLLSCLLCGHERHFKIEYMRDVALVYTCVRVVYYPDEQYDHTVLTRGSIFVLSLIITV